MSDRPGGLLRSRPRRQAATLVGLLAVSALAAGCTSATADQAETPPGGASPLRGRRPVLLGPAESAATVATNVGRADVKVDKVVDATAEDGTFESVEVTVGKAGKKLAGDLVRRQDHLDLHAAPRARHPLHASRTDGGRRRRPQGHQDARPSAPQALTLDQQTYPSFARSPARPSASACRSSCTSTCRSADKAAIEKHLTVDEHLEPEGRLALDQRPARCTGARRRTGSPAPTSPSTPTSTASRPATASTASSAAPRPSTWATR